MAQNQFRSSVKQKAAVIGIILLPLLSLTFHSSLKSQFASTRPISCESDNPAAIYLTIYDVTFIFITAAATV